MKLKKFFAGVLAAAMMLTVGATAAFAEGPTADTTTPAQETITGLDGTTKLTADSEVSIFKRYEVVNGSAPSETFEFEVKFAEKFDTDKAATNAANPDVNLNGGKKEIAFTGPVTGTNNVGHFTLTPRELGLAAPAGVGKYVYTITEKGNGTPAVEYDNSTLYLVVSVVHKTDSTTHAIKDGYDYYVSLHKGSKTGDKSNAYFVNTYGKEGTLKELTLSKTVRGGFGDLGEEFTFQVVFHKNNTNYAGALVKSYTPGASIVDSEGKPVTGVMAFETPYTVTLMHGKNIVFENLPAGVTYEILENGSEWNTVDGVKVAKKDQYTVSLETGSLTDNAEGKPVAKDNIGTTNASVGFINDHQGTPDMGVVLDNAPYIAMLAIVAIGGVALMLNKRRRDEE